MYLYNENVLSKKQNEILLAIYVHEEYQHDIYSSTIPFLTHSMQAVILHIKTFSAATRPFDVGITKHKAAA